MLSDHASKKKLKFVGMFHASMAVSTKAVCVAEFKSGRTRCLVSTIAFGMVCCTNCVHMYMYVQSCILIASGDGYSRHRACDYVWCSK